MRETITTTTVGQRRAWVLTKLMAGELGVAEAADLLGLSERSVWRFKCRFGEEGPAALVQATADEPHRAASTMRFGDGSASWPEVATTASRPQPRSRSIRTWNGPLTIVPYDMAYGRTPSGIWYPATGVRPRAQ